MSDLKNYEDKINNESNAENRQEMEKEELTKAASANHSSTPSLEVPNYFYCDIHGLIMGVYCPHPPCNTKLR